MAWESRSGSRRRYYTRSRWVKGGKGKVRREYVGTGEAAEQAAWLDAYQRETREIMARLQRIEQEQRQAWYDELMAPVDALDVVCDLLMRDELVAAGYRKVGARWRRPRDSKANTQDDRQ